MSFNCIYYCMDQCLDPTEEGQSEWGQRVGLQPNGKCTFEFLELQLPVLEKIEQRGLALL